MVKRLSPDRCLGAIVDVQDFFLSQLDGGARTAVETGIGHVARLLGYLRIPIIVTLERPVDAKGRLPYAIDRHLDVRSASFEKDFFDLTREDRIRNHLAHLDRKQAILVGCETDVCVLQSCLGLLGLGYDVYVVDDLVFSSSRGVNSALARMRDEGAVLLSYKSLYYELVEAVADSPHEAEMQARLGPFPDDLPDAVSP
jgi:isochorismate hydrolase